LEGNLAAEPYSPRSAEMLPVGDGHRVYVETIGRPDGISAVYLHGGPGSGCQPAHRRLFDPDRFRAVLFDQRGAGRSTPKGARHANTTGHLIADMEAIREHLGIARWLVVGGSWGATLALAYAERHPNRVSGLVLRATFLGTQAELDWAFGTGLKSIRPELHADFLALLDPAERHAPLDAYWRRILDENPGLHEPAARAWHDTERILSESNPLVPRLNLASIRAGAGSLPSTPFMEAHYFSNQCFLEPDQLMREAGALGDIPGIIVQGRYDLLCPPKTSRSLAEIWKAAELRIIEGAGHAQAEPGVTEAMTAAVRAFG